MEHHELAIHMHESALRLEEEEGEHSEKKMVVCKHVAFATAPVGHYCPPRGGEPGEALCDACSAIPPDQQVANNYEPVCAKCFGEKLRTVLL